MPPGARASPTEVSPGAAAVRAWCLYDWANSAFATTITAAVLPPFFAAVAGHTMPAHLATAWWGYASAAAMLVAALVAPVLGAVADRLGRRKRLLLACVLVGSVATFAMALVPGHDWRGLLATFGVAFIAFATGNVLYDSLLPAVAAPAEMHRVSARGFAYGYVGGGLLLAINLAWILFPRRFGLADAEAATRLSFASVAAWWLAFSLPLFRRVPEPKADAGAAAGAGAAPTAAPGVVGVLRGVIATTRSLPRSPELFRFLLAFWLYSDGIGTVIKMATVYGSEVGIRQADLIGALLMVQILAAPASIAFGRLARPLGPQRTVALGLAGYVAITVFGFYLSKPIHFWILAGLVAMVQGGTQALSRSMFASLAPRRQVSELFGFYSVSEKLAGVVGPVLFGLVAQWSAGRYAVLTLLPFFLGGAWLLLSVDLERGARRAQE